jgi:hypothetical protein
METGNLSVLTSEPLAMAEGKDHSTGLIDTQDNNDSKPKPKQIIHSCIDGNMKNAVTLNQLSTS